MSDLSEWVTYRHGARHHHAQAGHVYHVLGPRDAQGGRVHHKALHVHAAPPRPPRHLPELVRPQPAVPAPQVVGLFCLLVRSSVDP